MTRALPCILPLLLLLSPARADEAGVRRLAEAAAAIDGADEKVPAVLLGLQRLEGLRLDAADAPALRAALSPGSPLAPVVDRLRSLTVQGGRLRLVLDEPVTLKLKKSALALAEETTLVSRAGPQGELTLDEIHGLKLGKTPALLAEVRRLRIETQGDRRVAKADVSVGPLRRTLTFDAGPAPTSLARAVDPT